MSSDSYALDILRCPRCLKKGGKLELSGHLLACKVCKETYPVKYGIPQVLKDPALATRLEGMDYDDHHNIDSTRREKVAADWKKVFVEHDVVYGDVLEIGSGTGQLTWGLAHRFPFTAVHACDISTKFLSKAKKVVGKKTDTKTNYYACDANYLPFADKSFDLVVGHSVLHHFIDYQLIIKKIHQLLRPGGVAIFYEPVLQGKILIAYMAELMVRIEKNTKWGILDEEDFLKITKMNRHIMKAKWLGNKRARLEQMEDKYVFDINQMYRLALECGYKNMDHCNIEMPEKGYKWYLNQHLLMEGIEPHKIEKFSMIPNAFSDTIGSMVAEDIITPMGYFIFRK